ncbi:MAG: acyltransferase [Polyangiaceae bacterium]
MVSLREAFSPARNLRATFVPPRDAAHLAPLDGLRALSILWVVVFHTAWHSFLVFPVPRYVELLTASWMLPVWRGDFGVDVFFVLSGFLIGGLLVDEHAAHGRIRFGLFYLRRMMRLWPALLAAALVHYAIFPGQVARAWANVLYVSNFVPVLTVGMGWTWSLAIEEQFYLVCPWLVLALRSLPSARARALAFGALATGLAAIAALVVISGDFHPLDTEIVYVRPPDVWARAFDTLYDKPWMRAGPLLLGVASAFAARSPRFMDRLAGSGSAGAFAIVTAGLASAAVTHWPLAVGHGRAVEIAYVALYRLAFGAAVSVVLLFALSTHPVGARLGRALGHRALYPFAQLAYAAYLLNPVVAILTQGALRDRALAFPGSPMLLLVPVEIALTFAAALVLHVIVERPVMALRPRAA